MPAIHDYICYGASGVCQVEDIRPIRFGTGAPAREDYVLQPVGQESASIYVPADNRSLTDRMRPVLTKDEIDQLLVSVQGECLPWVEDRKQRLDVFRGILSRGDERELLLLARCLYQKSQKRANGLPSMEAQILKKAESMIAQGFAFSLHMEPQQVGDYIRRKLDLSAGHSESPHKPT